MRLPSALSLVLAVALALAPSALASMPVSAGSTSLDKKGCPVFIQVPLAPVTELTALPGEHCESLPTSLVARTVTVGDRCVQNEWVQIRIPKNVVDYAAVWYSSVGLGTRWWSGGATLGPATVLGEGFGYPVPNGYGAWSAAGGSSPAGGCAVPAGTYGVAGWGVTGKHKISGTLSVEGGGGAAANITVDASCPGGGKTTTDENGNYAYLVDANTTCTVAPRLKKGLKSTPTHRVVHVYRRDVNHVDFQVPCDAVPPSPDVATTATAHAAKARRPGASRGSCNLIVHVKTSKEFKAGLTFQPANPTATLDGGPLFATRGIRSTASTVSCPSGCLPVTVTVTDGNGVPVNDATLTADVTPIEPSALLEGSTQDKGYLCNLANPVLTAVKCGASLPDLRTDSGGVLQLVYWAPGVIEDKTPRILVTAKEECTPQVCPSMHRSGAGRASPTVKPDLLVKRPYRLIDDEKRFMHIWGNPDSSTKEIVNAYGNYLAVSPAGVLQSLAEHVLDVGEADPLFAIGSAAVQVAFNDYSAKQQVEQVLIAQIMSDFKLPEIGLGDHYMDWTHGAGDPAEPLVEHEFLDKFANWIFTSHYGEGALYTLAKELYKYSIVDLLSNSIDLSISFTDVSNCDKTVAESAATGNDLNFFNCGPGYFTNKAVPPTCSSSGVTFPDNTAWTGIRGFIYVHFVARIKNARTPLVDRGFAAPYNPFLWLYALHCSLPPPKKSGK